jgi:tRNA (guanine-N7-)-methyltransferase
MRDSGSGGSICSGSEAYRALTARRIEELQRELATIFNAADNFTWEVGSGHGHFLTAYAQAYPSKLCIGIDIVGERVDRAKRKRDRAKLKNLFFLRAEARLFLNALPAGVAYSDLFILFPDPWPKLRHHKHRILEPAFLTLAASRARESCRLFFRTDSDAYFNAAHVIVESHRSWKLLERQTWPFEFSTVFQQRAPSYRSLVAGLISDPGHP